MICYVNTSLIKYLTLALNRGICQSGAGSTGTWCIRSKDARVSYTFPGVSFWKTHKQIFSHPIKIFKWQHKSWHGLVQDCRISCTQNYQCIQIHLIINEFTAGLRRLTTESHEISKPQDIGLEMFDHSETWLVPWQQWYSDACQISEWYDHLNTQSCGFETLWDLTMRCLTT